MAEVIGHNHVYAPRAHVEASDWLPNDPLFLDGLTGGQLAIVGDMPVVCSAGSVTDAAADLVSSAGLRLPQATLTFRAGGALDAIAEALEPASRLVVQHAFPERSAFAERCWVPSQLLRDLNNKAKLEALVPASTVPRRRVVGRAEYFAAAAALPAVIKVVTDQSSAGGSGVLICRAESDLARAREKFARADQHVVEELLAVERSPCLNFAVMPDGAVAYLGHADQDVAPDGKFRGNWVTFGETLPDAFVQPARDAITRAAEMGYRGFAGVDIVITPDQRVYVVDLNFRVNASTPAVLLAPALKSRLPSGVGHFRALARPVTARMFADLLMPLVRGGRIIPLSLFDPVAAGYPAGDAVAQVLIVGGSKAEVLATEEELARAAVG